MSGVLTARQLAASLRVLRALRTPACATVLLSWGQDDLDAYVALTRAGYVEALDGPTPRKATQPFRWERLVATEAGLEYLRQVEAEGPRI